VTSKLWYFNHTWKTAQNYHAKNKSPYDTLTKTAKKHATNIYRNQHRARICILKFDGAIGGPVPARKQPAIEGPPSKHLDCGAVLR